MLSQKQTLRKSILNLSMNTLTGNSIHTEGKKLVDKQDDETSSVTQSDTLSMYSSESDKTCSSRFSVTEAIYDKYYRTTADQIPLGLEENMPIPRKMVTFSSTIQVSLIPCRGELDLIKHHLWWSQNDVQYFKMDAHEEVTRYTVLHKCSVKEGLTNLYQPPPPQESSVRYYYQTSEEEESDSMQI